MKKSIFFTAISAGILSASLAFATPQQAVEQVRNNATQVLSILKKANGSNDAAVRKQAEDYALPYFDFEQMTQNAVGNPWRNATPEQKKALTQEFKTLLIRTYSGTMLKFKNANVKVKDAPKSKKGAWEVETEVSTGNGKPVKIDFTVKQSGSKYRVSNVSVEGASLVTVYRNQFGETIKKSGIDGLIADLKKKNGSK